MNDQNRFIREGISSATIGLFILIFFAISCDASYGSDKNLFCNIVSINSIFGLMFKGIPMAVVFFILPFLGSKNGRNALGKYIDRFLGDSVDNP